MRKTKYYSLIVCIIAIPAVVMQERISAKPVSDNWFSVASVVHHNEALNGAHDVELSGNLAFVPAKGKELIGANRVQVSGSFAYTGGSWTPSASKKQGPGTYSDFGVVDISTPENPRIVASVPFSDTRGPNGLTVVGKVAFVAGGRKYYFSSIQRLFS